MYINRREHYRKLCLERAALLAHLENILGQLYIKRAKVETMERIRRICLKVEHRASFYAMMELI